MNAAVASVEGPLALICGGGTLPLAVADRVAAHGRKVVLFAIRGAANPVLYEGRDALWLYVGQAGKFVRRARAAGCRDVVLLGSLVRPALWQLLPDFTMLRLMPRIAAAYRGGDDHLLSNVGRLFEQEGFRLLGAHEVAPEILMPEGVLTRTQPSELDQADIRMGLDYLHAAGPFDVGQAVVVANHHILAVEAAEGTDETLARVAELRRSGRLPAARGGVLVKAPKPSQDHRLDLPSIGPQTVEGVVRAGLDGMAVSAGSAIIAEPEQLVEAADRAKVFVLGVGGGSAR